MTSEVLIATMVDRIAEQFDPDRIVSSARGRETKPRRRAISTCSS